MPPAPSPHPASLPPGLAAASLSHRTKLNLFLDTHPTPFASVASKRDKPTSSRHSESALDAVKSPGRGNCPGWQISAGGFRLRPVRKGCTQQHSHHPKRGLGPAPSADPHTEKRPAPPCPRRPHHTAGPPRPRPLLEIPAGGGGTAAASALPAALLSAQPARGCPRPPQRRSLSAPRPPRSQPPLSAEALRAAPRGLWGGAVRAGPRRAGPWLAGRRGAS